MTDLIGRTVGAYRIEALIGRGALGDVYRGAHLFRAQRVAIKVIRPSITSLPGFEARFRATMSTIATLDHPHILRLVGFDVQEHIFYVITDLVTGGSLEETLHPPDGNRAVLPPGQALALARQAIEGVAYAHALGITHANITPANLLLDRASLSTREGSPEAAEDARYLLVSDFGMAQLTGPSGALTSVGVALGTGVMQGSPGYMSPEQCRGLPPNQRSDVYALGIVVFELLTGTAPFLAASLTEMLRAHVQQAPPSPRHLNRHISLAVDGVILRCIAKDPDQRYADAGALAQALGAAAPAW